MKLNYEKHFVRELAAHKSQVPHPDVVPALAQDWLELFNRVAGLRDNLGAKEAQYQTAAHWRDKWMAEVTELLKVLDLAYEAFGLEVDWQDHGSEATWDNARTAVERALEQHAPRLVERNGEAAQ